jgi:hypothetical protein
MRWLAAAAITIGAILGSVIVALVVTASIQGSREGGIVDLPTKDD